jgi:hypothetical protein
MNARIVGAFLVLVICGKNVDGATVALNLEVNLPAPGCASCTLSGPGTWNLVIRDISFGDSFGIAGYGIPVRNVTSALHRSPRTNVDVNDDINPAGFTLFRSVNNATAIPNGFLIGAAQDTVTPTPHLIRGFGQEASSFAAEFPGLNLETPQVQTSWAHSLVLAEGRFNGPTVGNKTVEYFSASPPTLIQEKLPFTGGVMPYIDFSHIDTFVNVLASATDSTVKVANQLAIIPAPCCGFSPSWSLESFTSPNGQPASVDPATGEFTWLADGSPQGAYDAVLKYSLTPSVSLTGTLSIIWHVPEPTSLVLGGMSIIGMTCLRFRWPTVPAGTSEC